MKNILKIMVLSLWVSGCSAMQLFQPTPTPTPQPTYTATIAPTHTAVPTSTVFPTPDLAAEYLALLPQIPAGFEWKILPEKDLAVVIPDGWFFKAETVAELNLDGVYVTQ